MSTAATRTARANLLAAAARRWATPTRWSAIPPLHRELLALARPSASVGPCPAAPPGYGRHVLFVPGYLASDTSMADLGAWFTRAGWIVEPSGMRRNVDCNTRALDVLERRLGEFAQGRRALVVGHSRGGIYAMLLAARRPDLVAGAVSLAGPLQEPFSAFHPLLLLNVALIGQLGRIGVPGLLDDGCWRGSCSERIASEIRDLRATDVPLVSLYSRSDGVIDWRSCLHPAATETHEVGGSHASLLTSTTSRNAIAAALRRLVPE